MGKRNCFTRIEETEGSCFLRPVGSINLFKKCWTQTCVVKKAIDVKKAKLGGNTACSDKVPYDSQL